jgi:hypothetical protein
VPSTAADLADVLATLVPGVRRLLARQGLDGDDEAAADPVAEASPVGRPDAARVRH